MMDFSSNCRLLITFTIGSISVGDTGHSNGGGIAECQESAMICVWDWIHGMKPILKHPIRITCEKSIGKPRFLEIKCLPDSNDFITVTAKFIQY
jgi:hypothetical protein